MKGIASQNKDKLHSLKVLHLIDSGGLYGAERLLMTLVRKQLGCGVEAAILSAGMPGEGYKAIEQACAEQSLPCIPWRMNAGLNLKAGSEIVDWAKANGFSVLHSHGYKFNILMSLLPKKRRKLAFICTIHGYTASRIFSKLFIYKMVDRILSYFPDRIVVVNEGLRKSLLSKRNVRFIPNGIDIREENVNAPLIDVHQNHYIVVVGRLSTEKAVKKAISAFSLIEEQYLDLGLVIVGDGPERPNLEELARQSGLSDRIVFVGYSDSAAAYIAGADVLLICSEREGLPLTLLEAMQVRTPVVSTPVGEIPTVLGLGKFGYLSKDTTENAIAWAMAQMLENQAQASEKAELAYGRLLQEYTSDRMNERYLALYREVLTP